MILRFILYSLIFLVLSGEAIASDNGAEKGAAETCEWAVFAFENSMKINPKREDLLVRRDRFFTEKGYSNFKEAEAKSKSIEYLEENELITLSEHDKNRTTLISEEFLQDGQKQRIVLFKGVKWFFKEQDMKQYLKDGALKGRSGNISVFLKIADSLEPQNEYGLGITQFVFVFNEGNNNFHSSIIEEARKMEKVSFSECIGF